MKLRRYLCVALLLLLVPALALSSDAHPGDTDANGGHTDQGTGDYHYHHGFPAHAHFDMDGDGYIDCPYDFIDQTGQSSGTNVFSYSDGYAAGSKDGYTEGYADGYKKGSSDGLEDGYLSGKLDAQTEHKKQLRQIEAEYEEKLNRQRTTFVYIALLAFTLLSIVFGFVISRKKKALEKTCNNRITALKSSHASQIEGIRASHESEIDQLRKQIGVLKRLALLNKIASGEDASFQLPEGIHLRQSYTPIKGNPSKNYPYGEYTIFMSLVGKNYHCKHECVPSAKPMHFFDLPKGAEPCRRCVRRDMYPRPLPEWYFQLHKKLGTVDDFKLDQEQINND